jgi:hypothetical protein
MSEHLQLPLSHQDSEKDAADLIAEQPQKEVLSKSSFRDYIDLESDSSGIFGTLDIEAAKQFMNQIQP